jgi:hypothetical protein
VLFAKAKSPVGGCGLKVGKEELVKELAGSAGCGGGKLLPMLPKADDEDP